MNELAGREAFETRPDPINGEDLDIELADWVDDEIAYRMRDTRETARPSYANGWN